MDPQKRVLAPPPAPVVDHLDDHAIPELKPTAPPLSSVTVMIPYWGLIGVTVLAPLPHGSVEAWGWGLLSTIVGLLVLVWAGQTVMGHDRPAVRLRSLLPIAVPFAAAVLWAVAQISVWTPAAWHHPLWSMTEDALATPGAGRISLSREAGVAAVTRLMCYAGVFWLSLQYGRQAQQARQIILAVTFAGAVYAIYGLIQHLALDRLGWGAGPMSRPALTSTFATAAEFAAYGGVALVCVTGILLATVGERASAAAGQRHRWRRAVGELGWPEVWLTLAWLLLVVAIALTGSAPALTCLALALVVLVLALVRSRGVGDRLSVLLAGSVAAAVVAGTALVATPTDVGPAAAEIEARLAEIATDPTDAAALVGTGLGTFADVFRFYWPAAFGAGEPPPPPNRAIQSVVELGMPAALALLATMAAILAFTIRGVWKRRRDSRYAAIGVALAVLVILQTATGAGLGTPAAAVAAAVVLGVAVAQSWSSRRAADRW